MADGTPLAQIEQFLAELTEERRRIVNGALDTLNMGNSSAVASSAPYLLVIQQQIDAAIAARDDEAKRKPPTSSRSDFPL